MGPSFTWNNKREGYIRIKERFDKAVGNIEWLDLFPKAILNVLTSGSGSDHSPILLSSNPEKSKLPRPFRFHNIWLRDKDCDTIIKDN